MPQSDKTTKAIWEVTRAGIKIPYNQIYPLAVVEVFMIVADSQKNKYVRKRCVYEK